ncbi:MAG TPA: hypothetical protein VLF93_02800 [Candidatus Saccharimonadales bacterium]|nr:hypothetical protein [Candidatus Saccharimonadales bacterium]
MPSLLMILTILFVLLILGALVIYLSLKKHHHKNSLSKDIHQVTDEADIERLDELIVVTDLNFRILSVNDAVERTLQKSRSELIDQFLFDMVLLKNAQGELVKDTYLFPKGVEHEPEETNESFTLINAPGTAKTVTIQITSAKNQEANIHQLSFILSFAQISSSQKNNLRITIERARAKYEAMTVFLKNNLSPNTISQSHMQLLWLEKLENDIYNTTLLPDTNEKINATRFDVAKLCKQLVELEKPFADIYNIPITFSLGNFGEKDIKPLTVKNYPVNPEQLTGPFFTVPSDVKRTEFVIKKLLDLAIYLASTISDPWVNVEASLKNKTEIEITVSACTPKLDEKEISDLFIPAYGTLATKTNLLVGSGLEGFLAKTIGEYLGSPISTAYSQTPQPHITFSFTLKKSQEAL